MRKLEKISLAQIDPEDTTFLITFLPALEPLLTSIKLVGLLEPLCVRERDDGKYQLICGFKRADALRQLAVAEAEAFIYPQGALDDLQALLLTFGHNLSLPLNLIEKALALEKLLAFGVPKKEVINLYLPLFSLQPTVRILKQVTELLSLERGLQEYLVQKDLSLSTSILFLLLDKEGQHAILPLLEVLRPGENRVKEIISYLHEISLREEVSIPALLTSKDIEKLINDKETPRPQRIEQLRRTIKEMRFPRLRGMENKFDAYRQSLALPPQITFHPPPFFEGDQFKMELRFIDLKQLGELVIKLRHITKGERKGEDPLQEISRGR